MKQSIETSQDQELTEIIEGVLAEWEQEERASHREDSPADEPWSWGEWPDLD